MDSISVLLPARNAERTIRTAVTSLLRTLPRDGRVLILDDASEDATGEIIARLAQADRRVGILTSAEKLGVASALNVLLDHAQSPLVARMDADDICLPGRFHRETRVILDDKLDVVFAPIIMFGNIPYWIRPLATFPVGPRMAPYELLLLNALAHPTLVGRRSAFLSAGKYRPVAAEDWDLWIRMALQERRLGRVGVPNLLHRRHRRQTSSAEEWYCADTAQVHTALSEKLLGSTESGAFRALSGASAGPQEVMAALNLIRRVDIASRPIASLADNLSMRRTVWAALHRLKSVYGNLGAK